MQLASDKRDKTFGHSHAPTSPVLFMYAQRDPTVVLRMTADSVDFSFLHIKLTSTSDTDKFVADKLTASPVRFRQMNCLYF